MNDQSCTPTLDGLWRYEDALAQLLLHARPVTEVETVPLRAALGRVLAEPLVSRIDVPGWDYSAMDGYALRAADAASPGAELRVSQRLPAGAQAEPLLAGTAARIFTGAPIPSGADTVIMQEVCERQGDAVRVKANVSADENIRRRGEDIAVGEEVLAVGTRLAPQHLGLAASVGSPTLVVRRKLKVALFASGDELVMPGEPLSPGHIYNSNLFTASALLAALGCEVLDLGIVEDTLDATKAALARGARTADMILASGGVSVGEEDHVKPAVEALGSLAMWKVAIRPGKPVAFGHIDDTPFLGTPGNPVSLFVTFLLFGRPFLLKRMGVSDWSAPSIPVTAAFEWPRPDKRREYHRARLTRDGAGIVCAEVHPSRSSGVLSSVTWANGLVVIPEGQALHRGDPVEFIPFAELLT